MARITFSRADAEVLQRVRKVESLGRDGARLLLAAPVIDMLLAMGNPAQFSATVANSDFDKMAQGALSVQKIAACTVAAMVLEHIDVGPDSPTGAAKEYFERLLKSAQSRCER